MTAIERTVELVRLPLKMRVQNISFAAHVDYTQNSAFIDQIKPAHLVLFSFLFFLFHQFDSKWGCEGAGAR